MMLKSRFALVMLIVLMATFCFPGTVFAEANTSEAIKGAPTLDGVIDPIWESANVVKTEKWVSDPGYATADVRTMWDENYFYVLAEVTDKLLSDKSANPWEKDSVEIFFDELNEKTGEYDANDGQYRVNYKNETSGGGAFNAETLKSAAATSDTGYIVEMAIPWITMKGTAAVGAVVGFDVGINDDATGTGVRDGIVNWNDEAPDKYCNTTTLGNVKLADAPAVPAAAEVEAQPETGSGVNSTFWIVVAGIVIVSLAVTLVIFKKKPSAK